MTRPRKLIIGDYDDYSFVYHNGHGELVFSSGGDIICLTEEELEQLYKAGRRLFDAERLKQPPKFTFGIPQP